MSKCLYGYKKDGNCKKKPGPKKSLSRRKSRKSSKKCLYGYKKDGKCKKKPGPKKSRSRRKSRVTSRRRSRNKSRNKSRQSKRKSSYMTVKRCKQVLQEKIKQTTKEYKSGQFSSRKQAVAVAYSMINKKYPNCKRYFLVEDVVSNLC